MKKTLYIFTLSILFLSCKKAKTEEPLVKEDNLISITAAQFKSGAMEIATPIDQDFEVTVKTSGKIDVPPQNRAQITSFIGGYVKSTTSVSLGSFGVPLIEF